MFQFCLDNLLPLPHYVTVNLVLQQNLKMESSLIKAAEEGDIEELQELLRSTKEDDKNDFCDSLVAAAKEEKWDCVK